LPPSSGHDGHAPDSLTIALGSLPHHAVVALLGDCKSIRRESYTDIGMMSIVGGLLARRW
jgi:hypothetical protein